MTQRTDVTIAYCGVCCDHCAMRERVPKMAKDLKRFIDAYGYEQWIHNVTNEFDFDNLMKGLGWFMSSGCRGCPSGGGMPHCEVRECCSGLGKDNCYSCADFPSCQKLIYQKQTYIIDDNHARIMETGYAKWLREQSRKSRKGFDNIEYLEQTLKMEKRE